MHLHFSGAEAFDIDGDAAEHYRQDEGDSAINKHHHVGVEHVVSDEGEWSDWDASEDPVQHEGYCHVEGRHHEPDIRPDTRSQSHAEGEHEEHDADACHEDGVVLSIGVFFICVLVVKVEQHADHRIEESQCETADDRHLSPLEVLEHGNGDEGADQLRDSDENWSVKPDIGLVESESHDVACLRDEWGDSGENLHHCQHVSNRHSLACPGYLALLHFWFFVEDGAFPVLDQLIHKRVLVEECEDFACGVFAIFEYEGMGRFRDVVDGDEEELQDAGEEWDCEFDSPEGVALPLGKRWRRVDAEAVREDHAQQERHQHAQDHWDLRVHSETRTEFLGCELSDIGGNQGHEVTYQNPLQETEGEEGCNIANLK